MHACMHACMKNLFDEHAGSSGRSGIIGYRLLSFPFLSFPFLRDPPFEPFLPFLLFSGRSAAAIKYYGEDGTAAKSLYSRTRSFSSALLITTVTLVVKYPK